MAAGAAKRTTTSSLNAEPILTIPRLSPNAVVSSSGRTASMPDVLRDTTLEVFLQAIERVRTNSLLPADAEEETTDDDDTDADDIEEIQHDNHQHI